jgi:hypothetical protein
MVAFACHFSPYTNTLHINRIYTQRSTYSDSAAVARTGPSSYWAFLVPKPRLGGGAERDQVFVACGYRYIDRTIGTSEVTFHRVRGQALYLE